MRYTINNLRAYVAFENQQNPLEQTNGYGNYDRYTVQGAYGGYQVQKLMPGSTGRQECTIGYQTARECARQFTQYLIERGGK